VWEALATFAALTLLGAIMLAVGVAFLAVIGLSLRLVLRFAGVLS
jgi:hypothetical protein